MYPFIYIHTHTYIFVRSDIIEIRDVITLGAALPVALQSSYLGAPVCETLIYHVFVRRVTQGETLAAVTARPAPHSARSVDICPDNAGDDGHNCLRRLLRHSV